MSDVESPRTTAAVPAQRRPADPPPVAAAAVPDVVREFRLVHDAMRHTASLLVRAAAVVGPGRSARAEELGACTEALLALVHHHHTAEEQYWWPSLRERSPAAAQQLALLAGDHHDLDPLLETLGVHAQLLKAGTHDVGALQRDALELRNHLIQHLAAEEPVLLPLLAAHIDPAEAAPLAQVVPFPTPNAALSYLLGAMNAVAGEEDQQVVLRRMPRTIRWLRPFLLHRHRRNVALLTGR